MANLVEVNEQNRDSWLPLFPTYDVRYNSIGPDEAFCIMGRDGHGKVVATHAGRLFNLKLSNFCDLAQSLRKKRPSRPAGPWSIASLASSGEPLGAIVFMAVGPLV